jgi:hypothetical protein
MAMMANLLDGLNYISMPDAVMSISRKRQVKYASKETKMVYLQEDGTKIHAMILKTLFMNQLVLH